MRRLDMHMWEKEVGWRGLGKAYVKHKHQLGWMADFCVAAATPVLNKGPLEILLL